jgi:hypothetical protein
LTAVLAADVAGYSRLMGRDEEGTLAKLKSLRFRASSRFSLSRVIRHSLSRASPLISRN